MESLDISHYWVRGGRTGDRRAALRRLGLPEGLVAPVDAHRNRRGPFTVAGTLARALVPALTEAQPDLVRRHDMEILSVAPELSSVVPNSRQTLTSMALPKERTRFYARLRTRRIANGVVELVRDGLPPGRRALVVDNVEHAEPTDLEFVAAMLRRIDPARLTVVVCTGDEPIPDDDLLAVLAAHAHVEVVAPGLLPALPTDPAHAYVVSDGTSDDPRLERAYLALDPTDRARLHDARAAELSALDEQSLRLGAIPYHLEHGNDPAGAGARALYAAQDHCLCNGFYTAVVDYGYRGLGLIDWRVEHELWWMFTIELTLALSILSRTEEAERFYDQARLRSTDPMVHMAAAYSTAMLYTRHNDPGNRDDQIAKAWLNSAIATASLLADPSDRAFQSAFYKNGLALVEVNLGDPAEALRLVDGCIAALDRDLAPHEHRLHRSVLKNNRARVYLMLGRLEEALADYAVVIGEDPNHAEHYLERGNILRRLGRHGEAFADYEKAISLTPPFPEIYYNRGDLKVTVGDVAGGLADFGYVLELDPEFVDAYVNRAGLAMDTDDIDSAEADALAGLRLDPDNPYLHTVVGQVQAARGDNQAAKAAFDRAIAADPDMVAALSGRAAVAFELGDDETAVADLCRAVELEPGDAALRFNRAFTLQRAGRWDEARSDLEVAAGLAPDDVDILEALADCRLHTARA
jgi:tetratricopeptide (TPR) repeat protein